MFLIVVDSGFHKYEQRMWRIFEVSCWIPRGGGDLVVRGDVPVAKFRVSNSAIYYLLGSKNFQN